MKKCAGGVVSDEDGTSDDREAKLYPIQSIFQTEEPPVRSSNRKGFAEEIRSSNYGALTVGIATRGDLNQMGEASESNMQTALPREY